MNIRMFVADNQYILWTGYQASLGINHGQEKKDYKIFAKWQITKESDRNMKEYCLNESIISFEDRYRTFAGTGFHVGLAHHGMIYSDNNYCKGERHGIGVDYIFEEERQTRKNWQKMRFGT